LGRLLLLTWDLEHLVYWKVGSRKIKIDLILKVDLKGVFKEIRVTIEGVVLTVGACVVVVSRWFHRGASLF
jgi:hypothetical protein